jgi:hypothetical protein
MAGTNTSKASTPIRTGGTAITAYMLEGDQAELLPHLGHVVDVRGSIEGEGNTVKLRTRSIAFKLSSCPQ